MRTQFADMVGLGDVLLELTGALRINYEILGNLEPALHAHLFPRYASEPDGLRQGPSGTTIGRPPHHSTPRSRPLSWRR
jgi:hypothetical protein